MDSICFICYEDGGNLIDPHWSPGSLCKPRHNIHVRCFASWQSASKGKITNCPYCMKLISNTVDLHLKNNERRLVVDAIREKNLERFKYLLSDYEKLDDESRHIYLSEATIVGQTAFLEFIEEKYSLPYQDLTPFLAITLSMRSRKLYLWYWKAYDKRRLHTNFFDRRHKFDCQLLVAADIAKKKWLNRWLRFKILFRSKSSQLLPTKSIIYVTKFGRSRFTLRRASKLGGNIITKQDYLEHVVPQIVSDEVGWKLAYWSKNPPYFIESPEVGPSTLVSAISTTNLEAWEFIFATALTYNYEIMKNRFKTSDVEHLFCLRGKRSGHQIFQKLCLYQLVDLNDLRKHKIHLCRMSYQASNDELTKFFLSVLQECLTAKEIQEVHECC